MSYIKSRDSIRVALLWIERKSAVQPFMECRSLKFNAVEMGRSRMASRFFHQAEPELPQKSNKLEYINKIEYLTDVWEARNAKNRQSCTEKNAVKID